MTVSFDLDEHLGRRLYFEDLEPGQAWESPRRTVTEADVVQFAGLSGDYNALHTDAVYAAGHPFGQRAAHGLLTLAIASGLTTRMPVYRLMDGTRLALTELRCQWRKPVLIGDTIHVELRIGEKSLSQKRRHGPGDDAAHGEEPKRRGRRGNGMDDADEMQKGGPMSASVSPFDADVRFDDLVELTRPRSVMIVGASTTPGTLGHTTVVNVLQHSDFDGEVHLVNPKGGELFGKALHASVADVPGTASTWPCCWCRPIPPSRRCAPARKRGCATSSCSRAVLRNWATPGVRSRPKC